MSRSSHKATKQNEFYTQEDLTGMKVCAQDVDLNSWTSINCVYECGWMTLEYGYARGDKCIWTEYKKTSSPSGEWLVTAERKTYRYVYSVPARPEGRRIEDDSNLAQRKPVNSKNPSLNRDLMNQKQGR
ncbi:hypothetical protein B0H13DRAFT_1900490 [Mycena leptocephala]|nr:hypothetical protein B0H13DRAFT_1900490 [Mycena leptocephala]